MNQKTEQGIMNKIHMLSYNYVFAETDGLRHLFLGIDL